MALNQVGLERLNTATTDKIGERKNKIINGGMLVNQRGNQSSVTTSVYGLDRFKVQEAAAVTYDINQSTDTPDGFGNSFHIDIQGAQTNPAAPHFMQLMTALEGFDVQDFAKGTSEAKQYAVSFYIKTNVTGNYALQITDDNGRSCSQLYTVSDANWNRYTVIFPADTTGAIDNDNTEGLRLTWHLVVGTDRTSGTMNTTWAATTTENIAAGQNANVASSTSNNWRITGVQLEVGSVATDFEHRSISDELLGCYRYFQILSSNTSGGLNAHSRYPLLGNGTNSAIWYAYHKATMRVKPSLVKSNITTSTMDIFNYSTSGTATFGNMIMAEGDENHSQITCTTTNNFSTAQVGSWRWSNNADCYFAVDSEL